MERQFNKFKTFFKRFLSEFDIENYLLKHEIKELFNDEILVKIYRRTDKVEIFFQEFEMLDDSKKYEKFIDLTKESSEWIKYFLNNDKEAKEFRKLFYYTDKLFKLEIKEYLQNLCLNETVLHQLCCIELITAIQRDYLKASLDKNGPCITRTKFILQICHKSTDWYGKLLYIYYHTKSDFIQKNYPEEKKRVDKMKSEKEKEEHFLDFGRKLVVKNMEDCVNDEEIDDLLSGDCTLFESNSANDCQSDPNNVLSRLLRIQNFDHLNNLTIDEGFLFQALQIDLINRDMYDKLVKRKDDAGLQNTRNLFLLEIMNSGPNWYGKLLLLYYRHMCDFIPTYLPDLHKEIVASGNDQEKVNYILGYASSIIEANSVASTNEMIENQSCNKTTINYDGCLNVRMEVDESSSINESLPLNESFAHDKQCSSMKVHSSNDNETSNSKSILNCNEDSDESSDDDDDDDDGDSAGDDIDFNKLFGKTKGKDVKALLNFRPENTIQTSNSTKPLEMRRYQEELARNGIEGKNVLICSPTGSGKTVVAVKIVEEHLKSTPNGKVAFLVHRIALVEQQIKQFRKYLKCKITTLSGSSKSSSTPLIGHLKSFDLFVLTSDILRNALEEENETKLKSLNKFSLILFDECHNCDKRHPYNRIMTHYFKDKKAGKAVPQIIGLTASTGTNKARTMDKALKQLFTLCANMDTYIVSTVKEFKEDLEKNQSKPFEEIITPPLRSSDKFDEELQAQMAQCEKILQEMNLRDYFPKDNNTQALFNIPEDRLHQKYQNFVGKLSSELFNKTDEKCDGRKSVFAISSYLNAFLRALMVNHLFRAVDAVKLIRDLLELKQGNPKICEVEKILYKRIKRLEKWANKVQPDNPCLKELKDFITQQLKSDDQSRIIVFVRERNYTQILKNIFATELPEINCDVIVGNTISAEQGGLTQNEMEEILGKFRKGEINVLFSTTVAEEGLDVQECNLVIRYGHVTNETAMVQSRGRARAKNSKYIVIIPPKLQWQVNKENINKYRESMMYRAIEKFQEMDEEDIKFRVEECQKERELMETCEKKLTHLSIKKQDSVSIWSFNCKKCSKLICTSNDVRLAEGAHHIVINDNCFESMIAIMDENQAACQIKCANCLSILGVRQCYKGRYFPTLKIKSFSLAYAIGDSTVRSQTYNKWKDVPIKFVDCKNQELLNFKQNHSLSP